MVIVKTREVGSLFGETVAITPVVDREALAEFLYLTMRDMSLDELVSCITNRYKELVEYVDLCSGLASCQKTSLLFNPHRLDTKTKNSKYSIYGALQDCAFVSGLARATLFKKGLVSELLYQTIQLGVNGIQYCNEFPPAVARDLCKQFNIHSDSIVLDPCAGWGGRMLGVSTISNYYEAYEPSTLTVTGLRQLAKFIRQFRPQFDAVIHHGCFEDAEIDNDKYDFAITSPPYYDTEEYSSEDTNSMNRYANFHKWVNQFYIPLIANTMRALKPGCTFVLSIGSRRYPLNSILIDTFGGQYHIRQGKGKGLSGLSGMGKSGEGEVLYLVTKT